MRSDFAFFRILPLVRVSVIILPIDFCQKREELNLFAICILATLRQRKGIPDERIGLVGRRWVA